jgi:hypothetical protein
MVEKSKKGCECAAIFERKPRFCGEAKNPFDGTRDASITSQQRNRLCVSV